jgi:hypothetical protein
VIQRMLKTLVLGIALSGTAAVAAAQPAPKPAAPAAQSVTVEVQVVHATNAHDRVDSALRKVEKHLQFLHYTGFARLDSKSTTLRPGESTSVPVVGGREMRVTLVSVEPATAKLRVQLFTGSSKKLDTTVSIHRNRSFIVGGPKHEDGVLVFPLTAGY